MNPNLLAELKQKAQQRIAKILFNHANESQAELHAIGAEIAASCGCKSVLGSMKDASRAHQKIHGDYGGDWFELRDLVRLTIVAPDESRLRRVQAAVRARCVGRHGLDLIRDFEAVASASPCGFSGLNFAVRLSNGHPGEIQVNTGQVMYGQMGERAFSEMLGRRLFWEIKSRYRTAGGLGHIFYEIYRVAPSSPNGRLAAELSRKYFGYLRGVPNPHTAQALTSRIASFQSNNPSAFAHAG